MAEEEQVIKEHWKAYAKAWQDSITVEGSKIDDVLSFYRVPCLFVDRESAQPVVCIVENRTLKAIFAGLLGKLKKDGYTGSTHKDENIHVKKMSGHAALVSVLVTRHFPAGDDSFGATYTLCKQGKDWKIVTVVVHDKAKVLRI